MDARCFRPIVLLFQSSLSLLNLLAKLLPDIHLLHQNIPFSPFAFAPPFPPPPGPELQRAWKGIGIGVGVAPCGNSGE